MAIQWICTFCLLVIASSTVSGQVDTATYGLLTHDSLNNSVKVTLVPDPHKEFPNHQIGLVMRRTLIQTPGLHQIRFKVMVNPGEQPDTLFLVMVPEEKISKNSFEPEFMQSFPAYRNGEYTIDFTPVSWDVHIGFMAVKKGKGQYSYTIHDYSIHSIQPPPVANFRQGNSSPPSAYRERYRYGFNGKENDYEVEGQQDYGMRMYDSRLGRFKSVDPLAGKYPYLTPYQFSSNSPVSGVDLDGLEYYAYYNYTKDLRTGKTVLTVERGILDQYKGMIEKYGPPPTSNTVHKYFLTVINEKGEAEKFVLNSQTTINGRDKLHEKQKGGDKHFSGDFTGVSKVDRGMLAELMARGFDILDQYPGGLLDAITMETKSEIGLDYKFRFNEILDIPWNNLIEIEGVTYNANEAGNVVWSMLFELAGMTDVVPGKQTTPGLLADLFTRPFRPIQGDQPNEQQAIQTGAAIARQLSKDKNFMKNVNARRNKKKSH